MKRKPMVSLFVSFSSVFWKAVNFARIYSGAAAAAGLVELAFCVVFLTHKLHVLKTCLRLAEQGTEGNKGRLIKSQFIEHMK